MIAGIFGWVIEPSTDPEAPHGHHHGDEHMTTAEIAVEDEAEAGDGGAAPELEEAPQ